MLIEERAARYLASHRVQLCYIDGKLALVVPEGRFARMSGSAMALLRRLLTALSGRRPVDPETIIG
jgi:hypothetical protein